jgi:hypothetical protein
VRNYQFSMRNLIMKLHSDFKHLLFSYYRFSNAQLALQQAQCVLEFSRLKNDPVGFVSRSLPQKHLF